MNYFLLVLLAFGGLFAQTATAQTALGQPTLDEQKVQIWCATTRFVYDDTGRPNLKSKLRCGGSLREFESSIKADSQKVYSLLYQPLEGRGNIYKGLTSNPARLQALTKQIISRLRSSPSRSKSPARMQNVAALETALRTYVTDGTPIGTIGSSDDLPETTDTTATESGSEAYPESGLASQDGAAATAGRSGGESLVSRFFGPLALIFSLLSLFLYVLMRRNITAFQQEMRRTTVRPLAGETSSAAGAASLSAAQRREIEELVQKRVAEELEKQRVAPAPASAAPATVTTPSNSVPAAVPVPAAAPVAEVSPLPIAPINPAPVAETPAYAAPPVAEAPTYVAPAPVVPASPAEPVAPLVPDVVLPTLPGTYTRFAPPPVNGVFPEPLSATFPTTGTLYALHFDTQWPTLATFSVLPQPAGYGYDGPAIYEALAAGCEYEPAVGEVTAVTTQEEGVLRQVEGGWQIEQKATVLLG